MGVQNRFIKLLMFSSRENGLILLYGFSSPTQQEPYNWKRRGVSKTFRYIFKAILTESNASLFFKSLTEPGSISLGEYTFTSPELVERSAVISNNGCKQENGPITECSVLKEFWNTHKQGILSAVENTFGLKGKKLYKVMDALLIWLQEECGVDFSKMSYRFGNFECFNALEYEDAFEVKTLKKKG